MNANNALLSPCEWQPQMSLYLSKMPFRASTVPTRNLRSRRLRPYWRAGIQEYGSHEAHSASPQFGLWKPWFHRVPWDHMLVYSCQDFWKDSLWSTSSFTYVERIISGLFKGPRHTLSHRGTLRLVYHWMSYTRPEGQWVAVGKVENLVGDIGYGAEVLIYLSNVILKNSLSLKGAISYKSAYST